MRLAYADPPYKGCGRLYDDHHEKSRQYDDPAEHLSLLARMEDEFDGWAYSCNPRDLRWLLPALPETVRVAPWCKTWHQIRPTSVQHAWEVVLFHGGRKNNKRNPMVRDWLVANATRQRGLPGAKPETFARWVLDMLGYEDGDELVDIFPGTGVLTAVAAQQVIA